MIKFFLAVNNECKNCVHSSTDFTLPTSQSLPRNSLASSPLPRNPTIRLFVTSIYLTSYPPTLCSLLILQWGELLSFEFPTKIFALLIWPPVLRYLNVCYLNIFVVSELKTVSYIYWLFHSLCHVIWRTVPGSIPGGVTGFFSDIFLSTVPWPWGLLSP